MSSNISSLGKMPAFQPPIQGGESEKSLSQDRPKLKFQFNSLKSKKKSLPLLTQDMEDEPSAVFGKQEKCVGKSPLADQKKESASFAVNPSKRFWMGPSKEEIECGFSGSLGEDRYLRPLKERSIGFSPYPSSNEQGKWTRGVLVENDKDYVSSFSREKSSLELVKEKICCAVGAAEIFQALSEDLSGSDEVIISYFKNTSSVSGSEREEKLRVFYSLAASGRQSPEMHKVFIESARDIQELEGLWKYWLKKEPLFPSEASSVRCSYLRSSIRLKQPRIVYEEWKKVAYREDWQNDVELFNICLRAIGFVSDLDSSVQSLNPFVLRARDVFYQLHQEKIATEKTYRSYLKVAAKHISYEEADRVYQLAGKKDPIISFKYIDVLVQQQRFEEANLMLKSSISSPLVRHEKRGCVSIDLHSLSYGVGYLCMRNAMLSHVADQIAVIHGIGSMKQGNLHLFRDYLREQFMEDKEMSRLWRWEMNPENIGQSFLVRIDRS